MRFIIVKGYDNEDIAINASNITSIKKIGRFVAFCMSGDIPISTQFTDIEAAVDYIQRAESITQIKGV
tara:strand:+ start:422 stop:625 length:204 start_codon:yes stop_codon:yes gene_type:complete